MYRKHVYADKASCILCTKEALFTMRDCFNRKLGTWIKNKMSITDKQYGLIEPKTGKKLTVNDVFNNDSDSDREDGGNDLKKTQKEEKSLKKQTKLEMQRALDQDPTVYQYDEVYDEMTQKKQELLQKNSNPEKKPKYINELLKTAEKRKKENERRLERQIQKEREAEGDMYKDKEEFITSSYKQKLEEFKKAEEEERKMEYIESIMDVSKQQDLGGFYRHLYKETIPNQDANDTNELLNKKESNSVEVPDLDVKDEKSVETVKHERNYRKRNHPDSIDGEKKVKHESSSSSSDSDTSSDSSSTSSSSEEEKIEVNSGKFKQNERQSEEQSKGTFESNNKNKKDIEKINEKSLVKNLNSQKSTEKSESRDDRFRNSVKSSKFDERDKREKNYGSSGIERDRGFRNQGRDDRNFRDRDRNRREDRRNRDRSDRSSDYRRRRSKTPEKRDRNRSRERSIERSRSKRNQERENDSRDGKGKKDMKDSKKQVEIVKKKENEVEEQPKISIWEKRTVGSVYEAAMERYKQRKAARGS